MSRPALFLDRDGTLIEERGFIDRLDMVTMFPWTGDALRLIRRAGYAAVVVTNQSAIARGMIDEPFLDDVHRAIAAQITAAGGAIERYYYCPHLEDGPEGPFRQRCACRKPRPGMIEAATRDLDLDLSRSAMVGDRWLDVVCGRAAGVRALLVRSGHGHREADAPGPGVEADAILNNLMEAVGWILRNSSRW